MSSKFMENFNVRTATEKWLTENGYSFESEVTIAGAGRADYVALHADNHYLIAECKSSSGGIEQSIKQVLKYQSYFGVQCRAALFIPDWSIDFSDKKKCKNRGVTLIGVDVDEPYDINAEAAVVALLKRRNEWGDMKHEITNAIMAFHCPSSVSFVMERLDRHAALRQMVWGWNIETNEEKESLFRDIWDAIGD